MDLSFPLTASEYNKHRTGACFTVRSANSPLYILTCRPSVRKSIPFLGEKREGTEEDRERQRNVTCDGTNGTNEEEHTFTRCQGTTESRSSVKGQWEMQEPFSRMAQQTKQSQSLVLTEVFGNHDRTSRKKYNMQSRSRSLDWRAGPRSPDFSRRVNTSVLSPKGETQAAQLEKRQTGVENVRWGSKGHSLPSRMRSQSEHSSKFTETSVSPKGQSILERIEKLYGSAGFDKAEDHSRIRDFSTPVTTTDLAQQKSYKRVEGGTFPRHFSSSGDGNNPSPGKVFPWAPQTDQFSVSSLSAGVGRRSSGGLWQEQMQDRYSEADGGSWGKGLKDIGTRSLDRARSRNTVAIQIQSARAAAGIVTDPVSNTFLRGDPPVSGLRERNTGGRKDQSRTTHGEESSESNREKEAEDGATEQNELKGSNADEDVFESYSPKVTPKTVERSKFSMMLPPLPAASVRNKINQFEALSQRAQGSMPRRALSVPVQSSTGAIGGLRDRWGGMKKGEDPGEKSQKKAGEVETKLWSERSVSVDEGGIRLIKKEREAKQSVANEHTKLDSSNYGEYFGKYSKLKSTLEIPLNADAQRRCENIFVDETDFSKAPSPEEAIRRDVTASGTPTLLLSSGASAGVQKPTPSPVTPPVGDDDKTPTNTPNSSPCLSPIRQPENATPFANTNSSASATAPDPNFPPLPHPLATSSHSRLPGLTSPDVDKLFPKGKKASRDLKAWVAGLNSDISVWNDEEDDYEDDDESTQKDEDSNYDSDSGESSVTVTSNMSQSDRRSFCVSLSDLCHFAGVDDDSENDSDEWQSSGRRSVSLSSDVSALSCVSVMPSEELDRLLDDVKSLGDNTLQDYNDVQVVVLHKEMGVGLGFSLAGGMDQNKPVTVHKVFHSGVAAQEGSIREGDHILSINGTALCGYAHWEAVRVLRKAKSREMAVVVLRRGDVSGTSKREVQGIIPGPTQAQFIETGHRVCVCLEKNSRDLGFTLEGGVGSSLGNRPLTVQKIFQGGPVDKVSPGDEVLDIEGVSTVGMSRLEAWTLIRKLAPGPVNVVLHRSLKHQET